MNNIATPNTTCRICKNETFEEILDFGDLALTGVFEIDGREVVDWCKQNFGKTGYQEEHECARWLEEFDKHSITLLKDEDLTLFLLRWT
jgi:hypothetical protein